MSFQTGLSGLNAASNNLDVIGHNIANSNTVGMKAGRAEFQELVAAALGAGGGASAGIGVSVATVSHSFTQGNLTITGNNLDVAVNGGGFYQVTLPDGSTAYTRDGQFKLTQDGEIVTNGGAQLMGFPTDFDGNVTSITVQPLVLPTGSPIPAQATANIGAEFNLDARADIAFENNPPTSVTTYGTSINAYDSQGVEVPVSLYFIKTAEDTWSVFDDSNLAAVETALQLDANNYALNGGTAGPPGANATNNAQALALFDMQFDVNGLLTAPATAPTLTLTSPNPNIGNFNVLLDVDSVTQFGTPFAVTNLTQDGYTAGELTGIDIDASGVILARYSNGETQANGQIALANFRNPQGLQLLSGGNFVETYGSGQPIIGQPGVGSFGSLQSGALESSNVDLTAELVNMITAQRSYQANAQTIKTQDQVLSTLVNLR